MPSFRLGETLREQELLDSRNGIVDYGEGVPNLVGNDGAFPGRFYPKVALYEGTAGEVGVVQVCALEGDPLECCAPKGCTAEVGLPEGHVCKAGAGKVSFG